MPRLSIAAARRFRGNASPIYRSLPLCIDDDDRTQTIVAHDVMINATLHNHHLSSTPFMLNKREYHSTSRRDILPFIAVGLLGATTVYTYRTLQQVDNDWDDYYDALEEYKAATGLDPEKDSSTAADDKSNGTSAHDLSSHFTGGTLAIDLGTSALKLSHSNKSNSNNRVKPQICEDREGYRSTPALIWIGEDSDEGTMVGRMAKARSFDKKKGYIIHPRLAMKNEGYDDLALKATREIIHTAASNALEQIFGGGRGGGNSNDPLFVLDSSMVTKGSYNVRPVFTYPNLGDDESQYLDFYRNLINDMTSPVGIASFVAEPIVSVTGAEHFNLLPPKGNNDGESVLVIDVGGLSTSISLVSDDKEVLHSSSLPFGGDTFIDALVSHLIRNFDGFQHEAGGSPFPSKPTLRDESALQRLYEASTHAVHELSSKTRSEINIPYLTMDVATRQPKHLEVGVARAVVESEVQNYISNLAQQSTDSDTLSRAFPPPSTLSALFSSVIMSTLEKGSLTPFNLRAMLLVGGGARIPLVRESLKSGVAALAGDAYANGTDGKRLIMPEGELCDEINVIGAALVES